MSRQALSWYVRRLRRMEPAELAWRVGDQARRAMWKSRQIRPGGTPDVAPAGTVGHREFASVLPADAGAQVPGDAAKRIVAAADAIMGGELEVFGQVRTDLRDPDWFWDGVSDDDGARSDPTTYAFSVNHRSESEVGNIKRVWELSRHHHLTQLAAAWYLTRNDAYAERVADQLRSWWRQNPYLSGVHWTSGIEAGIRLINWTWIRRLLADWPPVIELFDDNNAWLHQLYWHQEYLYAFRSRGSSANNHVIAEMAGLVVASTAFPWFNESARWRASAADVLEQELAANTFSSGINRELASDYHRFVTELGVLAAVEADVAATVAGDPFRASTWALLAGTFDAAAAIVDTTQRPPRQGDDDEGRVLVLEPTDPHRWSSFLALGAAVVGAAPWWPTTEPDAVSVLAAALGGRKIASGRPDDRPAHLADAGVTILRSSTDDQPEIWCRCDAGPHGYLSIAAHAHADALSIELRVGGVDVLADPGTYCYHGEPEWRDYFRSTLAHNTLAVGGREQSTSGGPFLWVQHANGRLLEAGDNVWSAEHDGYAPVTHQRRVVLDGRTLDITDRIDCTDAVDITMAYHLGPAVTVQLDGPIALEHSADPGTPAREHSADPGTPARLAWPSGEATVELPAELTWATHRGETDPIRGWYSPRFGEKVPSITLIGAGTAVASTTFRTRLTVAPTAYPVS